MKSEHKAELKSRHRNIALSVAYDGTNYNGFQRQNFPSVAVQNVLEDKLAKIFGERIEMTGSGRTDAGVHAFGQVVNFFTDGRIALESIPIAASCVLPADIVVRKAWEVDKDFSALHSAKSKSYVYRIQRGETVNPFVARFAWHIPYPLDVEKMRTALNLIVGEHDFSTFKAASNVQRNPIREIFSAEIFNENFFCADILTIKIHANGFLYRMARNIVASVVAVGRGRLTVEKFTEIFMARDRNLAPPTAPANGLCLYEVFY